MSVTAFAGASSSALGAAGIATSAVLSNKQAKKNRQFQERMAKTRYQYTMADMKAAGLNPILAYGQGGGGVPTGATGQVPNMEGVGKDVLNSAKAGAELQLLRRQEATLELAGNASTAAAYASRKAGQKSHAEALLAQQAWYERQPVTEYYRTHPRAALGKEAAQVGGNVVNSAAQLFRLRGSRGGPRR